MDKRTVSRRRPLTTSRPALLLDNSDRDFREMVRDLVAFSERLQEIRVAIARAMQLTPPQYNILMSLAQIDEAVTVGDLAERLRVSVPFIVTETRRLEALGLLEKRADLEDRRRVHLVLTDRASAALREVAPLQVRVNDVLFETLRAREMQSLKRLTRGLLGSCEAALQLAQSQKGAGAKAAGATEAGAGKTPSTRRRAASQS